jgi:hypothetical protein
MQKQQALNTNTEVAGATQYCSSSMQYTVMQKQQVLQCNAQVSGVTL